MLYRHQKHSSKKREKILNILISFLKVHRPTEIPKLYVLTFHVISPNATKCTTKLDKKILKSETEAETWRKSAGLQGWKWITVHQF